MTTEEAVAALDAIADTDDPREVRYEADRVLLAVVDPRVASAYSRLIDRTGDWWYE